MAGMKKIFHILLLFILIAPFAATYIGFRGERIRIKKEVRNLILNGISNEDLIVMKFLKSDSETRLRWEHSTEFEYSGKMYDVVRSKTSMDSITLWCWCDNDESQLIKEYKSLVAKALGQNHQKHDNNTKLIEYLKTLYLPEAFAVSGEIYLTAPVNSISNYRMLLNSSFIAIQKPPPKFKFLNT